MRWWLIAAVLVISGCGGIDVNSYPDRTPQLVLKEYFSGRTNAWGIFEDRFGKLRRQFQVTIDGQMEGQTLVLDEHFVYDDGERQQRVWRIERLDNSNEDAAIVRYQGQADDVIGFAEGRAAGNALNWRYTLALPIDGRVWQVEFDDWMWLQPGGVLINRARVSKWGLTSAR